MSTNRVNRLWNRPVSRRAALRTGGIALATSSLAAAGLDNSIFASRPALAAQAEAGDVSRAVSQLDDIAADGMDRTGTPGLAISVVHEDEVVYVKGFGVREAGTPGQVDPDTVFQLASVSKPVASTVVASLVGAGVISWDSKIADLNPSFAMYDPWVTSEITVRDMFAHRSGLPDHAGDALEDIGYDRQAVLHRLRYQKPDSSFRSAYAYTNFGLTAAAVAAAEAAGLSWEDLSDQNLYGPLGMNQTSSRFEDYMAANKRAQGHVRIDGIWKPEFVRNPDAQSPAGGVSSTVRDMAEWMRLQLGNGTLDGQEFISGDALAETHRPQMVSNQPADPFFDFASFYGLGWNVSYDASGRVTLAHSGGFVLGASTTVYLVPAFNLGICVLANVMPIGLPEAVALSFLDVVKTGAIQNDYLELLTGVFEEVLKPLYDSPYDEPPANPSPALELESYVGIYANQLYGQIEVANESNSLVLHLGPEQTAYPLEHYDRDVFLYQPTGENAGGLSSVTFSVNSASQATSVVIDNLDIEDQGTFERSSATS